MVKQNKAHGRPGNPNWVKDGPSPNPGGRPAVVARVRELAREQREANIRTLVEIRDNTEESGATRIAAANSLLDRDVGRPTQAVKKTVTTIKRTPRDLSLEELEKGAAKEDDGPVSH